MTRIQSENKHGNMTGHCFVTGDDPFDEYGEYLKQDHIYGWYNEHGIIKIVGKPYRIGR